MEKMKKAQEKNVSLDATEKIAQLIIDKVQKQNKFEDKLVYGSILKLYQYHC